MLIKTVGTNSSQKRCRDKLYNFFPITSVNVPKSIQNDFVKLYESYPFLNVKNSDRIKSKNNTDSQ